MKHLVFIDDDRNELDAMRSVVAQSFKYQSIKWPEESSLIERKVPEPPDIFVLDLYLPPRDGPDKESFSEEQEEEQRKCSLRIAECFQKLYPPPPGSNGKDSLRRTMECLTKARQLLDMQWEALDQDPKNGLDLLHWLRTHTRFCGVPVVFYSRKITPEDVVSVLKAGAADALRKPQVMTEVEKNKIRKRFDRVIEFNRSRGAHTVRQLGLNANYTLLTD